MKLTKEIVDLIDVVLAGVENGFNTGEDQLQEGHTLSEVEEYAYQRGFDFGVALTG